MLVLLQEKRASIKMPIVDIELLNGENKIEKYIFVESFPSKMRKLIHTY